MIGIASSLILRDSFSATATLRLLIASAVLILAGILVYLWGARRALAVRASQVANP
jgi:hypothetical protein